MFSSGWWAAHPRARHARWHYHGRHHPHYWWRAATWVALTRWLPWAWGTPYYYDYGYGGNVYYEGDTVYVNNEPAYTAEEYATQAMDIAAAVPNVEEEQVEWMPLGVFALTHGEKGDPDMLLQLAVSKEGIIAGVYQNTVTETTLPVEGMVDKETQRAAWTIGDNKNTVLETGIYNLTQEETPVLVHFGKDQTQTWLMVRLEEPEAQPAE